MTLKKYSELELFRFVLCIMMVFYHLLLKLADFFPDETFYSTLSKYNHIGRSGVLIFFIFSGFFFYRTLRSSVGVGTVVKKKIIRLWPVMALSLILNFNGKGDFYNLFFLSPGLGVVKASSSNPAMWYVCCLFWITIIFFLLFSDRSDKQWKGINATLLIVVLVGLGLICNCKTSIRYDALISEFIPFLTNGTTYALVGFSIGILFAQVRLKWQIKRKILVSAIQIVCVGYFIWLNIMSIAVHEMIYYIIWTLIIMYFLVFQVGCSTAQTQKLFSLLGKWSYSIYAMQFPCFAVLRRIFSIGFLHDLPCALIVLLWMFFSVAVGVVVHYLVERPATVLLERVL